MISKKEILNLAKLARLEFSEKEVEDMQEDLSKIFDYFNSLKNISLKKDNTQEQKLEIKDKTRDDDLDKANKAYGMIQDRELENGYIKVKSIL